MNSLQDSNKRVVLMSSLSNEEIGENKMFIGRANPNKSIKLHKISEQVIDRRSRSNIFKEPQNNQNIIQRRNLQNISSDKNEEDDDDDEDYRLKSLNSGNS